MHDDLHIPNPISPMYADIGGWWLKCDYMFRRFGTPFASDWISKIINGYVYTAAIPAEVGLSAETTEYGARYTPRTPTDHNYAGEIGGYLGWVLRPTPRTSWTGGATGSSRRSSGTSSGSTPRTPTR